MPCPNTSRSIPFLHALQSQPPSMPSAGIFSLAEEEEEEGGNVLMVGDYSSATWAAELGMLAIHAGVLLTEEVRE
jgi:hypothetical protein